jgi:hypothetical protein
LNLMLIVFAYKTVRYILNPDYISMVVLAWKKAPPVNTAILAIERAVRRLLRSDCGCGHTECTR